MNGPHTPSLEVLPIVSDPEASAANTAPVPSRASLGEVIAALQAEADAITDDQSEADALVVAAVFGMQFELRVAEPTEDVQKKAA